VALGRSASVRMSKPGEPNSELTQEAAAHACVVDPVALARTRARSAATFRVSTVVEMTAGLRVTAGEELQGCRRGVPGALARPVGRGQAAVQTLAAARTGWHPFEVNLTTAGYLAR
jgi:predicted short-subunit dehydrogenase-like oxidoreductase (DUF2520 family)